MKELVMNGKRTGVFQTDEFKNGERVLYQPQVSKSAGRKNFGPGTAKSYNERASKNSFNHYSPRANHNGWNAMEK